MSERLAQSLGPSTAQSIVCGEGAATCVCSFSYKTSLALIPVERHESWGVHLRGHELKQGTGSFWKGAERIEARPAGFDQLRVNLNAPGDHYDPASGRSFLAWPQVTGAGDNFIIVPVEGPTDAEGFRFNSDFTEVKGTDRPWIYASGLVGETSLKILGKEERTYSVLLHFSEPEPIKAGDRVFDVMVNGRKVLSQFDIVRESGGPKTALGR